MHLFLITSVVYTNARSIFSPKERLVQLIESIKSVREKVKDVYIVVIEGSFLTNEDIKLIEQYTDLIYYVDIINSEKSIGEVQLIKSYLNYLYFTEENQSIINKIETISKLSGRYRLTEKFSFHNYDTSKSLIVITGNVYHTTYYRFNSNHIYYFLKKLEDITKSVYEDIEDIEHSFFKNQPFPLDTIEEMKSGTIGIFGYIAPTGDIYSI